MARSGVLAAAFGLPLALMFTLALSLAIADEEDDSPEQIPEAISQPAASSSPEPEPPPGPSKRQPPIRRATEVHQSTGDHGINLNGTGAVEIHIGGGE